ncbi:hypothetical protein HMPREF1492_0262 [Atopobium sp. BS2]|nr:hypothetical protein HMPREF1492_0262 [Atopobium sp. BS2]
MAVLQVFIHFIEQEKPHFLGLYYLAAFFIFSFLTTIGISMLFSCL